MGDATDAWKRVGEQVEALGLTLRRHLEPERADDRGGRPDPPTSRTAFEEVSSRVADAFEGLGRAVQDDEVHAEVRDVAESIKLALVETFGAVGAEAGGFIEQVEDLAEGATDRVARVMGVESDRDATDDADDDLIIEIDVDAIDGADDE